MQKIDAEKVQKYQDAINEAIRIHTKKATESLPYNKSELVEIVDITERNLGKYIVWNGSTRYYAYSENTTYDIGMKVYVNIPNSDFAAQKTIIGQYVADGEKSVVWRNPLDAFQPLPDINLLDDNDIGEYENKEYSLLANWDLTQSLPSKEYRENNQWTFPLSQEIILFESKKIAKIREDYEIEKAEILANEELSEEDKNNQLKILDEEKINKLRNISSDLNSEYQGHTYLGITADFKTLLETFAPIDGDYGLRLEVFYHDKVSVMQDVEVKTRIYTLSAKNDMIGNVYNYKTYFTQASLFDISDIENIIGLRLYFFQSGDFKRNTNQWVPVYYSLGSEENNNYRESLLQNNIFVKDIKIKVGDDLISKNDRLRIKTLQGLTYSTTQNDAYNFKKIELEWDHLDPDADKFEILNKTLAHEKIVNYKIHWYRDAVLTASEPVDEIESEEELNEDAWNNFKSNPTKENFDILKSTYHITNLYQVDDYNINNDIVTLTLRGEDKIQLAVEKALEPPKKRQDSSTQIDNLAGKGWQSLTDDGDFIYNYFLPDTKKSYSKVMAIVEYNIESNTFDSSDPNYVMVKSNILEFTNEVMTSNPASDDKNNALQISCEDGSNGNYPIYSSITRQLLSRADVSLKRNFKATCKSLSDGSNYLNGNETIIWKIPKFNTMIVINDSFIEESAHLLTATPHEEIPYDDNYYFIERSANNGIDPVSDTQLYQIAPYFNKACVNNTIYCYIIKNNRVFPAEKTLTFNQHGSSGTDYTFTLGFKQKVDNNWNVIGPADTALTVGDENYLEIDFRLFNSKNEEIELTLNQKNAIIEAWTDFKSDGYYSGLAFDDPENETDPIGNATNLDYLHDSNNGRVAVRIKPNINDIGKLKYIVLQASVNSNVSDNDLGKIDFIQLLPIHVRAAGTNWILNGSDYIIYDDKGANPNFYNDAYSLTDGNNLLAAGFIVDWTGKTLGNISYYPKINNDRKLVPTPLYVKDITREIFIDCFDNNTVIYTCPLVILQNKYQIPAINKWNGELLIDSSGNKVLAAMVGAGHKNGDNTFSGVLMGDIEQEDPYDPGTKKEDTGLFGYDEGTQTFGFNVNGEAFIGASGTGRIYVNGNTGRITSAAREQYEINKAKNISDDDPRGTDINLKDNYIDIQGANYSDINDQNQEVIINNNSRIHLDTMIDNPNGTNAYLSVDSESGNRLLHIGKEYYLQTDNYDENRKEGLKIDLANGNLDSYDKLTIRGAKGSSINFGDNKNYINLGISDTGNSYFEMMKKGESSTTVNNEFNAAKNAVDALVASISAVSSINDLPGYLDGENTRINSQIENDGVISLYEEYLNAKNLYDSYETDYSTKENEYLEAQGRIDEIERQITSKQNALDNLDYYIASIRKIITDSTDTNFNTPLYKIVLEEGNYHIVDDSESEDGEETVYRSLSQLWDYYGRWSNPLSSDGQRLSDANSAVEEAAQDVEEKQDLYDQADDAYQNIFNNRNRITQILATGEENGELITENQKEIYEGYLAEGGRYSASALLNAETARNAAQDALTAANENLEEKQTNYDNIVEEKDNEEIFNNQIQDYLNSLCTLIGIDSSANIEYQINNNQQHINLAEDIRDLNGQKNREIEVRDGLSSEMNTIQGNLNENCKNSQTGEWLYIEKQSNWNNQNNEYQRKKTIYDTYIAAKERKEEFDNGYGDGYIKINDNEEKRIEVGDKFWVNYKGEIRSTGGTIGGFTIGPTKLSAGDASKGKGIMMQTGGTYAFAAGADNHSNYSSAPFSVTHEGSLKALKGTIGNWVIGDKYLKGVDGDTNQIWLLSQDQSTGRRWGSNTNEAKKDWRILVGPNSSHYNFGVDKSGNLYANGGKIAGNMVVGKLTAAEIDASKITSGYISASRIAAGSITASKIAANSITANQLNVAGKNAGWSKVTVLTGVSGDTDSSSDNISNVTITVSALSKLTFTRASLTILGSVTTTETSVTKKPSVKTSGSCFEKGTKILMGDLSLKNIEEIKAGEFVLSYNENTKQFIPKRVQKSTVHHNTKEMIKIYFSNNKKLQLTQSHPILTKEGWMSLNRKVAYLESRVLTKTTKVGQIAMGWKENPTIKKIVFMDDTPNHDTYNITVEDNHNYIANGIIVHNAMVKIDYL